MIGSHQRQMRIRYLILDKCDNYQRHIWGSNILSEYCDNHQMMIANRSGHICWLWRWWWLWWWLWCVLYQQWRNLAGAACSWRLKPISEMVCDHWSLNPRVGRWFKGGLRWGEGGSLEDCGCLLMTGMVISLGTWVVPTHPAHWVLPNRYSPTCENSCMNCV